MSWMVEIKERASYKGLTMLTPGHIYKDDKGKKYLFVGYGNIDLLNAIYPEHPIYMWRGYNRFMYLDIDKADQKLRWRTLTPDFRYCEENERLLDLIKPLKHPKVLVEDLGEYFSPNHFERFESASDIRYDRKTDPIQRELTRIIYLPGKHMTTKGVQINVTNL